MSSARQPAVCCFTSFSYSYSSRARILAQTVRQAHPEWALHAVIVDQPPKGIDPGQALPEFDRIVAADTLAIPRFKAWMFKHDIVEACTAVKGQMLLQTLRGGCDIAIYLDPDIAVFHRLDGIIGRLQQGASILLTPHQTEPNTEPLEVYDNELISMQYGVYNLGFVGVRNDASGRAFAAWWAEQLHRACYDSVETGLFTDQKYCDLAPGLFDGVGIERDPGCNVASWNLSRRRLSFDAGGGIAVNGSPLKFYHFTKIGEAGETKAGDIMTDRYGGDNTEVFEIWNWYKRALAANDVAGIPPHFWHYGQFSNGAPIPKAARVLYRNREDLVAYFDDPFEVAGDSLLQWLQREAPETLG